MIETPSLVYYKDHMGDDLMVVNVARVSFDKESSWQHTEDTETIVKYLKTGDVRLIHYLAKHNHWTPFAHPQIQLKVHTSLAMARQLVKHQVGLVWNEVSRRYVDDQPEFYIPEYLRPRAENVKQGSEDVRHPLNTTLLAKMRNHSEESLLLYLELLELGVCPEQARFVLPLNTHTDWYWTGSLAAWARVCNQRLDPHAQKEVQEVAIQIHDIIQPLFPYSWKELVHV